MKPAIFLNEIGKEDFTIVGEKVFEVSMLDAFGFNVPKGFCITSDVYKRYMKEKMSLVRKIDHYEKRTFASRAALETVSSISEIKLAPDTIAAIKVAMRDLIKQENYQISNLAMRPCIFFKGTGKTAYTGKYRSYFNVQESNMEETLVKCYCDLFSEENVYYRMSKGISGDDIEMSLLIQVIVDGAVCGKAYSSDLRTNDNSKVLIEAGLGNQHTLLFKDSYVDEYLVNKISKKVAKSNIGELNQPLLDDKTILKIEEIASQVQISFEAGKAVEWTLDKDKNIWLLQSQNIESWYPCNIDENIHEKHLFLSLGHLAGTLAPISPLGKDLLTRATPLPLKFYGERAYIDVQELLNNSSISINSVAQIVGKFDELSGVMIKDIGLFFPDRNMATFKSGKGIGGKAKKLFSSFKSQKNEEKDQTTFIGAMNFFEYRPSQRPEITENMEKYNLLLSWIDGIYKNIIEPNFRYFYSLYSKENYEYPEKELSDISVNPFDMISELIDFIYVIGEKDSASREEISRYKNSKFAAEKIKDKFGEWVWQDFESFFEKYDFWGGGKLDIIDEPWRDDPATIFEALKVGICKEVSSRRKFFAKTTDEFGNKEEKETNHPQSDQIVINTEFCIGKAMQELRLNFEEIGEFLANEKNAIYKGQDIMYLTLSEISEIMSNGENADTQYTLKVIERKKIQNKANGMLPPRIMLENGISRHGIKNNENWFKIFGKGIGPQTEISGVAKVITSKEKVKVTGGEILIMQSCGIEWAPIVISAKGVVTECGGEIGFFTKLCEKMDIPAVVSVDNCMQIIKTGDKIKIDSQSGVITKLDFWGEEVDPNRPEEDE